jgi:polysaccharide pyruvyl transferase WcaK-like protein
MWRSDLVVVGGGGLLQDRTSSRSLLYYLALIRMASFIGTHVFLYAIGVESLERPYSKRMVKASLDHPFVNITVRDEESKEALKAVGVPQWKMTVTQDPVFSLKLELPAKERYGSALKRAVFIPRYPCSPEGFLLYDKVETALRGESIEIDELVFHPSVEKKKRPKAAVAETLEQTEWLFTRCDYVVSARYHGLVLAALSGRPFLGIGHHEKVGRFCEACNMPFLPWNAGRTEVAAAIAKLKDKSDQHEYEKIETWRARAKETLTHAP